MKHLLKLSDLSKQEIIDILDLADQLKYAKKNGIEHKYLAGKTNVTIISGTARGADRLGERYAAEHNMKLERFPAEWDKYHKGAGPIRNHKMVLAADAVVVFWDNESSGSKNIIDYAREENVPYKIIRV